MQEALKNMHFRVKFNLLCDFYTHANRDVLQYNDVTVPLALTDFDELENKTPPQSVDG